MNKLVRAIACMAIVALPLTVNGREKAKAILGADIVSGYIWRGQDFGSVAIQPTLGVAYKGISLSAWGSYGITGRDDTKELDFTLAYTHGNFTVGLTDYYCVRGGENCPGKYFLYRSGKTAHVYEAFVGYDFRFLSLKWHTNFAGADGVNQSGSRAYSSYVEAVVPFRFVGLTWGLTVGAVPYATSYYASAQGFAVTNVSLRASKEISLTKKFSLPLFAALTANPSTEKFYFTAGFSL